MLANLIAVLLGIVMVHGEALLGFLGLFTLLFDLFLHLAEVMFCSGLLNLQGHEGVIGFVDLNADFRGIVNSFANRVVDLLDSAW